jgi:predicted transcriptional regulator
MYTATMADVTSTIIDRVIALRRNPLSLSMNYCKGTTGITHKKEKGCTKAAFFISQI